MEFISIYKRNITKLMKSRLDSGNIKKGSVSKVRNLSLHSSFTHT